MENISKLYGEPYLENLSLRLARMKNPEGVPYFLSATDEGAIIRQIEFDKYLEVAYRHEIIDDDLRNRLKNNDWNIYLQARNELMAAYFIESIGHSITFHPHGQGNTKGEFNINLEAGSIFTEVKSPIRKPANRVWTGNDADTIRRVIRDAANKQLDKNNMNLLIYAGDMKVSITHEHESGVVEALFGTHKIVFDVNESGMTSKPVFKFEPTGLFQPKRNTRISAVATLEDRLTEKGFHYSFKLFHNPFALKKISIDLFKGIKQYAYNDETDEMNWIYKKKERLFRLLPIASLNIQYLILNAA